MRVLGIVGSMRKDRQTNRLVNQVVADMKGLDPDVVAEVVHIADSTIHPCRVVCSQYCASHPYQCAIADDLAGILGRMVEADALVIGAPLYFRGPPAGFQAFAERLVSSFFFREMQADRDETSPLAGKPCGLVGVAEYSNPHQVLEYLHDFCLTLKMDPVALGRFPYLGVAGQGDLDQDGVFKTFERSLELAGALVAAAGP
jgi:multimeric flavodoxin WrbA